MKKILLLIILALNLNSLVAQTTYSKEVEEQIKQVENNLFGAAKLSAKGYNLIERMAYYKVKGLSIAVVHNYQLVWAKGYGWADEKEKRSVTVNTLFQAASNSKPINALGVLRLVQDKKLDLYTDINTYLKSWKFPYDSLSKNKKISLANLLSHTAGLDVHGFQGYNRKAKIPTITQILDGKAPANSNPVRSLFEPGLKFQYSGGGTTITRLIITDVTGQPYDKFMYDSVLKPLGMLSSFFTQPPPNDKLKMLATGYDADGNEIENKFHIYPEQGPDGLWTTPLEMSNYIIETQLAYEGKSSKVLTQEMTKLYVTPYIDKEWALGVVVEERNGVKYFSHGAGNAGFRGKFYGSLEGGNGVIIYVNSDNSNIIERLANSVATVYKWKGFCDTTVVSEIAVPDAVLEKYTGVYFFEDNFATIFKKPDGHYYWLSGESSKMHFISEREFITETSGSKKVFVNDEEGNITGFIRKANGKEFPLAVKINRPDTIEANIDQFESVSWQCIENKKYADAIAYCKRGLQLYPHDEVLVRQMAYAYLFNGNYDEAKAIFETQLKETWKPESNWKKTIQQVLIYFKDNGYDVKAFDKLFTDLQIKKPKGY